MNLDAKVNNQIFRKDWPQVLAKNRHLASLGPTRLASIGVDYVAGTVLALRTDGLYVPYVASGPSGTGTAAAVLEQSITDDSVQGSMMGVGIFGGEVYYGALSGVDSGAVTNLNGRTYTASDGNQILKF